MKFGRWNELKKTFRFRLAAMHMLMVSVALAVSFAIALLLAREVMIRLGTSEMKTVLHTAQGMYLGAQEEDTEQLPEDMLGRMEQQFPNIHIGLVAKEEQPDGIFYEIFASTGNENLEILADPNGEIWIAVRKSLTEIFEGIENSLRADGNATAGLLICAPDGTPLLANASAESSDFARYGMNLKSGEGIVQRGDNLCGGVILYDGNRLYVMKELKELDQIMKWAGLFFSVLLVVFIPLSGWIGFLLSRKAMAGVQRVSSAANRVREGNFQARVVGASEGTEIEKLVETFNAMVSQIDLLMRELREVTANIAHDLKTPVTRIRGLLESSGWEEVDAQEQEQLIASAIEECDRVIPLINSILELSRAEAGMLLFQSEKFDLADEVRSAHEMFSSLAEDREIRFECQTPGSPVWIKCDRQQLQRVIANLIDNAIKFAPVGGEVAITLEERATQLFLIVRDNGPGIPKAELENVFKRFYRLDPCRGTPGHGMGLSMVRALVNAFGGSVSIESDVGKGCAVQVSLPL